MSIIILLYVLSTESTTDYLYFTDWVLLSVLRANKYNADDVVVLRKDIPKPMGIVAVSNQTITCKNLLIHPGFKSIFEC
jgi:hypothetical protein